MNEDAQFLHKYLWKLKTHVKIKKIMWFHRGKVWYEQKITLPNKNGRGVQNVVSVIKWRRYNIFFISCPFIRIIWPMINFTYSIPPPANITNMFGNWLNGIDKDTKARIHMGVSAVCWATWHCQNNLIFNKQIGFNLLQVIRMAMHWIHLWSYILPVNQWEPLAIGCNLLLVVARDFYFQVIAWRHINTIKNG
jgi:hypothetical protein